MDPNEILLLAANTGLVSDVIFALDRKANVDIIDDDGHAAIHLAALSNNPLIIEALLRHKVNLEAKNEDGLTAFQLAMDGDFYLAAEALASAGCDTTMDWPDHSNALHKAAKLNRFILLLSLLNTGPNIHQRNNSGRSPLMIAAEEGHSICVRMLLTGGAKTSDLARITPATEIQLVVAAWKAGMALAVHS